MFVDSWVPSQNQAPVLDYLLNEKKAKTFFLMGADYNYGRGTLAYTRKYIESHAGKVVGEDTFRWMPSTGLPHSARCVRRSRMR